jgi:hypothetical protein
MKRRQHSRAVLPALVLCLAAAAAAMLVSPAASGQGGRGALKEIGEALESFDRLSLDPAALLRDARESGRVTLQTSRGTFELDVEPFDIRADNYRAVAAGEGGRMTELPRTPSRSWRGHVRGAEDTQVRLVLDGEKFAGIVVTPGETFFVESARNLKADSGAKEYVFYAESSVKDTGGECGTTLAERVGAEVESSGFAAARVKSDDPTAAEAFAPKPETEIATEADFEYFQSGGSNEAATNADILDIFTQVDAIYEAQLGIHIHIVFQRVWTTNTDPYTLTDASAALNQFRTTYNQSFTNVGQAPPSRDLTHMFTGKEFDGSTIGIAYISAVCVSPGFSYGISESKFNFPNTTSVAQRVAVTAHELGHNFGAGHTNDPVEIDKVPPGCSTSIMNASVQNTSEFCPFSRDQITSHVTEFGACLARLSQPGCTYTLTSANSFFFGVGGGVGSVGVATSQSNCDWALAEGADWIDTVAAGVGPGGGTFNVAPNTNSGPREAVLDVAGKTILVRQAASPSCVAVQLSPGQTVAGALASTDCRASQPGHPYSPTDLYTFTARAGQRVRIEMLAADRASNYDGLPPGQKPPAPALDTLLYLFGPNGTVIAGNDDRSSNPHDTDSVIADAGGFFKLPATGVYTIVATSFDNYDNGDYTLRFLDNSSANSVALSSASYAVDEGTAGGLGTDGLGFRVVTVTRSGDLSGTATVDYATADGTAGRQKDYIQTLGTLVFAPGEASRTFTVFVEDDAFAEAPETVQLTLSNPSGTTLGATTTATLTINNNDAASGPSPVRAESFDTAFFVRQQYLDFFSREPDASGFAFWQNDINSCGADAICKEVKRINVSAAFFLSIEFQETGYLVYRAYKAAYGDATSPGVAGTVPVVRLEEFLPDTQRIGRGVIVGQGAWEQQLEANKQAFALEFVLRPRFLSAFPLSMTAAEFVDKLNSNAGFPLTQGERDQLVAQLDSGADSAGGRASALRAVADSAVLRAAEFRRAFVLMQYYGYLRRNPDEAPEPGLNFAGWNFWLSKLNENNGNFVQAEMVKAFLTSFEYIDRFGTRP